MSQPSHDPNFFGSLQGHAGILLLSLVVLAMPTVTAHEIGGAEIAAGSVMQVAVEAGA